MAAIARPSTSGGLSTRGTTFDSTRRMSKDDMFFTHTNSSTRTMQASSSLSSHHYHPQNNKRISRDDMYIRSRMVSMARFHVPVPAAPHTPEHSPNYYPEAQEVSLPIRMQTPESMTSGDIPIGMALGSPTLTVPAPSTVAEQRARWQAQFPPASPAETSNTLVDSERTSPSMGWNGSAGAAPVSSLSRKKTGRKKLFGLFGGGGSKKQQETEIGQGISVTTKTYTETTANIAAPPKTPTRSNTQADRKAPRHKPIMLRSNTMPADEEAWRNNAAPKSAGLRSNFSSVSSSIGGRSQQQQQQRYPPPPAVPPLPLLDVTIPDTKLERYSVMFSDVLNPRGPKPEPAASLLARRQATLERLKTINDRIEEQVLMEGQQPQQGVEKQKEMEKEKARPVGRRATSPQPHRQPPSEYTVSPRLSVFPTPPTTTARVARSNTSPGRLPSPTQGTFEVRPPPPSRPNRPRLEVPNPFEMNPPTPRQASAVPRQYQQQQRQEPIYPTDTTFHFGPDQSGLILDSPTSFDGPNNNEEIIISQPFRPTLHEPQWQMISPSNTATNSSSRSRSTSSATTHTTKPSTDLSDAGMEALQSAVEVSIARQISISRQQRNLLRPLQSRRGEGGSPLAVKAPTMPVATSTTTTGMVKEVSAGTPTLVQSGESPVPLEHRKSSWVVLESD